MGWEPLPEDKKDLKMKAETRECMVRLLKARSLILRILAATNDSSSAILAQLADELRKLENDEIPSILEKLNNKVNNVTVPLDAVERLREVQSSNQLSLIAQLADSLSNLSCPDQACIELLKSSTCLKPLDLPSDRNEPVSYKQFFLRASTCGETLAFVSVICNAAASQIKPNISKKKNKRKNTKETILPTTTEENQVSLQMKYHSNFIYFKVFFIIILFADLAGNRSNINRKTQAFRKHFK